TPKTLRTGADLRAELTSRLSAGAKLPTVVAKALTWDQAITALLSPDEERRTRERLKSAMSATGEDGGYAALGDNVGGGKRRQLFAASDTRLLVGVRGGQAKVVGILVD